ncbi:MAG: hypothetical protein U5M51_10210 [Emticicia sp.]|nr:hypothetical protein [Emticicia sp.]
MIFYFRLPTIVFNEALNPDENLFIVGALTLAKSPLYWESVDGCTSGPFNFYIITAFCELFGQPYDYISARIVGVSLMIGACLFSFLALQILFSASIALLSLFPAVAFLGLTKYWDFINYSSEQLPIFLMSVMLYLFAKMYISKTHIKRSDLFIYGFISGSVIFTKLQAIPIAFCLTLMGYWLIFLNKKKDFLKNTIILTAGGSITLVVFMLVGYYYNFLDKIWIFYFKNNLYYGNESLSITKSILASLNDPINIFIRIILLISCISIFYRIVIKRQFRLNTLSVLLVLFTVGTIISVYKTGFIFHHYLLFLICPSVFLFAFLLNDASKITKKPLNVGFSIMATIFVVLKTNTVSFSNYLISADKPQRPLSISQTGHQILKYSRPSESIVIWGDAGRLYLETKRTQGIRWSNTHWGMYSDSLQKNFQNEFISELKEKPYPVFVDAHPIKNTFMTRDKIGYETNQKLKEYIDKNYRLIGDFNEQRVFIHNERLAEMNTSI